MKKKSKISPQEQRRRFEETARKLGADETEAGQEKAFSKVGMKKSTKSKAPKK